MKVLGNPREKVPGPLVQEGRLGWIRQVDGVLPGQLPSQRPPKFANSMLAVKLISAPATAGCGVV